LLLNKLSIDIDIAAGIYIYALEEFGKLLLLKDCKKVDERYIIKYRDEFVNHRIKSSKAFDYLQLCMQILPTILL
jgi:hypothetical protein